MKKAQQHTRYAFEEGDIIKSTSFSPKELKSTSFFQINFFKRDNTLIKLS